MRFGSLTCLLSLALVFGCGDTEPTSEGTAQKTCIDPDCCFSDDDCAEGEYCNGEGPCDSEGTCTPVFAIPCPLEIHPVCGCDGVTYQGSCAASSSGHRIDHDGACEAGPCFSNDDCNEGEYCEGDGACDSLGRCKVISAHPCGLAFDTETGELTQPVCGCDGVTYQGDCQAITSGHRIAHDGVCGAATCFSNDDCAEGVLCVGGCDSVGACKLMSFRSCGAPPNSEPACGCDGVTYQSACQAIDSGQRLDHYGVCE